MPLVVGLTGGIGSGKTTVAQMFEELGVPVFYSDEVAKAQYKNPEVRQSVTEAAGADVYEGDELNRKKLADRIFSDENLRQKINDIIHPRVRAAFMEFFMQHAEAPYLINEAAILFESGGYRQFHKNILVTAPEDVRLRRVITRDSASEEEVKKRMAAQWPDGKKMALADFIIENLDKEKTKQSVRTIHELILKEAAAKKQS